MLLGATQGIRSAASDLAAGYMRLTDGSTGYGSLYGSILQAVEGRLAVQANAGGSYAFWAAPTYTWIDQSLQYTWGPAYNSSDTGLARSAAGVVKVTDGSTGYGRIRYEQDKREFGVHKTPGTATTVTAYGGAPTHTLTGTASNVSDATGHYVQLSGDGAVAGIDIATTECVKTEIDPVVTFIVKTGALIPTDGTERIWIGLASASLAATDSPSGIHVAAFRYAVDVDGTVFWRCVTNDGGADTGTTTTTTTAIAAATRYGLTIDCEDSASIKFFINGALVATHTTNLPTVTQALGCTCLTVDAGAGTQEILISKIHYVTT
jgi:hypothetical protein